MSKWLGKLGHRIEATIKVKGFIHRKSWNNKFIVYLLEDTNGNILTIRSSGKFPIGQVWTVEGKVKRQSTFHGQKQTHISDWGMSFHKQEE